MLGRLLKLVCCFVLLGSIAIPFEKVPTIEAASAELLVNGGFELSLSSWTDWGGTAVVSSPVATGSLAARVGTGEGGAGQTVSAEPGAVYTLSGAGRVSVNGEIAYIGVDCLDANNTKLSGGKFELTYNTTAYVQQSISLTTVPGTAKIQVYIYKNPGAGGYAYFDNLSLTTVSGGGGSESPIGPASKGMWIWELSDIATANGRNELIQFSLDKGINVLFVNTGTYQGVNYLQTYPAAYRALITAAHQNGIRVESLDGSSEWVRAANHAIPLARIQDVLDYNAASAENEQFDGIHHDNEPYTLADWSTNQQSLGYDYLELAVKSKQKLADAGSAMSYSGDTPFWYEEVTVTYNGAARPLYQHIIDIMDYITIMDYRDFAEGPNGIIVHGETEVNYAASVGKKVMIGVETYDVPGDPEIVTFYQEGEAYMNQELSKVLDYFSGNSGFGGLAIHYYTTYRTMAP